MAEVPVSLALAVDRVALLSERRGWAYALLLPSLVLVLAVLIYPVGSGIVLSFQETRRTRPDLGTPFVGLRYSSSCSRTPWLTSGWSTPPCGR